VKRFLILLTFLGVTAVSARDNPFLPPLSAPEPAVQETEEANVTDAAGALQTVNFQQARFVFSEGKVRIESRDALKKHFVIRKPTRIILDFTADTDFPTRKRVLNVAPFSEIRLGTHPGYYRAVIELKSEADYTIEPYKYGYILTLQE